ncbi:IclR family transcriptional regulator [Streptomyces canus]|uniref:IclR family acetate operon transcriptional repressor n=1 Tax=Streptomyces canus TaxID=58343 RepID=A0AAW8FLR0_9ACTN|nr:IclR family transcriptional regulator [Streptomyces canus]MDQ0760590.1 IclR family acetate operon transcriptional repressor [Streptomyces canus]MDQ0910764.1 IclR family acetate operon transcriptional repressor [Streptomyces canus]MDQ1070786.1 IclR family acetate operon transcriptional repressor [Streptomyces canus]
MTAPVRRNQATSLRRALTVLEYIRDHAGTGRGMSLTRIAEDLGINKSTVLRLTSPLMESDLLVRDRETGWFRLGHGTLRLGQAYLSSLDLRTVAAEPLRVLQHLVGETCHLVVYEPPDVVYIDKVENETNVRMGSRIGSRVPAYRTAVGKAILAWQGEEAFRVVVAAGMPPVTAHTVTDAERLRLELDRVRRRGYAIDDRENEPEVRCVAAPVFDHTDAPVGALSVSGLTTRMTPARVREVGPMVVRIGMEISHVLGSSRGRDRDQHKATDQ